MSASPGRKKASIKVPMLAVFGIVTRYNKKTVTVLSEDGMDWKVSPQLLHKVAGKAKPKPKQGGGQQIGRIS